MIAQYQSPSRIGSNGEPEQDNSTEALQARASVKQWMSRITRAKMKWEPDFKRMRKNMEFATGLQWPGQTEMDDERYVCNLTNRLVNQKVATLYAKNPTAVALRRERQDFALWDGNAESIMGAIQHAQMVQQSGQVLPPDISALFEDYIQGKERQEAMDRFCETFKRVYQYQVDAHKPDFKVQMKQLVRRTVICGVGYVRPIWCSDGEALYEPSTIDTGSTVQQRMARVKELATRLGKGDIDSNSAEYETMRSLIVSLGASAALQDEVKMPERIEFDFLPSDSVIPDERCRNLVDFIGARWVAVEYILPVDEVNSIFSTHIKAGGGDNQAKVYTTPIGSLSEPSQDTDKTNSTGRSQILLYEILDYNTKTRCFICDGWNDYVCAPEPLDPAIGGFWQIFALTFNDVEASPNTRASIFPPSDVQMVKSAQREWNRTREALRDHRNANAPKYLVPKGVLTTEDKEALRTAVPNQVIELDSVPAGADISKMIMPMQFAPIDPRLYDTAPLEQDIMVGGQMQQANVGPAQPNVTATVGNIAEQSRLTVSASNIDDLDGLLSRLAQASGEMLLKKASRATVQRISGHGALWPEQPNDRLDFLNEVNMTIEAASSGRPNKATDISNFQALAPVLQAAGANPIGMVQEAARRLDDNIDLSKFFPLTPPEPAIPPGSPVSGQQQPSSAGGLPGGVPPSSTPEQPNPQPAPAAPMAAA